MVVSIELEDNVWTFLPADTINGKVVIDKNIWNKVEGLTLRFYGHLAFLHNDRVAVDAGLSRMQAQVPVPGASYQRESEDIVPGLVRRLVGQKSQKKVLLDHSLSLLESWKVLKPGRHEFPFSFVLPPNLPPSLKVKDTRIEYEFVTTLKRPRDDFKVYQTPFSISSSTDEYLGSSFVDEFLQPGRIWEDKKVAQMLGCCMTGKFSLEVDLQRRIFPVGGIISFMLTIRNGLTRSNLENVEVSLVQKVHCKSLLSSSKEVVMRQLGPFVAAGDTQVWEERMQIPGHLPVSNVLHKDLFEVQYYLKFKLRPSNHRMQVICSKLMLMIVPVTVFTRLVNEPRTDFSDSDDSIPPPSYDEAIQSVVTEAHKSESTSQLVPGEAGDH